LDDAVVVDPGNTEDDLAFRFTHLADNACVSVFGVAVAHSSKAGENFFYRLVEFRFSRVAFENLAIEFIDCVV